MKYNPSSSLLSLATDASSGANMLSDSDSIYNHDNPAFIHVQNMYNTGDGQEAGIILHSKSSFGGAWAIYGKRTTSSYKPDLIFRGRSGSSSSAERMRINSSGHITMPEQPYVMAGISGNIAVNATTTYEIVFNSVTHDTASAYNSSNGRFTPPVTGDYLCTLDVQYTGHVNGFHLGIGVNNGSPGTNFDFWNHTGDSVRGDNIARVIRVTANGSNYISFYTYSTTGGTLIVTGKPLFTPIPR